jgi:hypothetical protein
VRPAKIKVRDARQLLAGAPLLSVAPSRPSVIVDMTTDAQPRFTCPWSLAEMERVYHAPVPQRVVSGMYMIAWAAAEHCPIAILAGRLEPHRRHEPSDAVLMALAGDPGALVGVLGFGVPVRRDELERARWAAWPDGTWTWGRS